MVSRQIEIDEETDQILSDLAKQYQGDLGLALRELVHSCEGLEALVEESEAEQRDFLASRVQRAKRGFREGRYTPWEDVKRQNGL
jgi:hypothetical protein